MDVRRPCKDGILVEKLIVLLFEFHKRSNEFLGLGQEGPKRTGMFVERGIVLDKVAASGDQGTNGHDVFAEKIEFVPGIKFLANSLLVLLQQPILVVMVSDVVGEALGALPVLDGSVGALASGSVPDPLAAVRTVVWDSFWHINHSYYLHNSQNHQKRSENSRQNPNFPQKSQNRHKLTPISELPRRVLCGKLVISRGFSTPRSPRMIIHNSWPPDPDFDDDYEDDYEWEMQIDVDDNDECLNTGDVFNDDFDDLTPF